MTSRHQPIAGADSPDAAVTYRVPLRSLDSDHTTARFIRVYGPRDLAHQLEELRVEYAGYSLGTPRQVEA
jgi:hypothetical protein